MLERINPNLVETPFQGFLLNDILHHSQNPSGVYCTLTRESAFQVLAGSAHPTSFKDSPLTVISKLNSRQGLPPLGFALLYSHFSREVLKPT
jgi:hypothetical protein